ncbi:uncharacterized protein LOC143181496 isoform X2 [Calliopsis andreniformis]|uniref:uncharacterized protein LOC143181496 isoform X2 n=1 Tax=Calliopsis andreniformis TaxID=337506 RepID=UPI003FCC2BD9
MRQTRSTHDLRPWPDGHAQGERGLPRRDQARRQPLLAVWAEDVLPLSQVQRGLHVQEDPEDPHEVRLRQGAEVQVSLLQQEGQVLVEHLQACQDATRRHACHRAQELGLLLTKSVLELPLGLLLGAMEWCFRLGGFGELWVFLGGSYTKFLAK